MASVPLEHPFPCPADVRVVPDFGDVLSAIESGRLVGAGVDMPIGLAGGGPRRADMEARRRLGPRRSSVFPAPARSVLSARTYEEACALSQAACGKAISRQLFNILPKIKELDERVTPAHQRALFEMCPELSFAELAGTPMQANKKTAAGRAERVAVLQTVFADAGGLVEQPPPGAAPDDVFDALAGAWTARRYVAGDSVRFGGELDDVGLRMEVIA